MKVQKQVFDLRGSVFDGGLAHYIPRRLWQLTHDDDTTSQSWVDRAVSYIITLEQRNLPFTWQTPPTTSQARVGTDANFLIRYKLVSDEKYETGFGLEYKVYYDLWLLCANLTSDDEIQYSNLEELLTVNNSYSFHPVNVNTGTVSHYIENFFYKATLRWDDESILNDLLVLPICPPTEFLDADHCTYLLKDGQYFKTNYSNAAVGGSFQYVLVANSSWFGGNNSAESIIYYLQNVKLTLNSFEAILSNQEVEGLSLTEVDSHIENKLAEFQNSQGFIDTVSSLVQGQGSSDSEVQSLADRITILESSIQEISDDISSLGGDSQNDGTIQSGVNAKITAILDDLNALKQAVYTKSEVNKIVLSSTIIAKAAL